MGFQPWTNNGSTLTAKKSAFPRSTPLPKGAICPPKDYKGISGGFGSYAQRDAMSICCGCAAGRPGSRRSACTLWHRLFSGTMPFLKLTTCEAIQMRFNPGRGACHHRGRHPAALSPAAAAVITPATFRPASTGVQPGEAFDVMPWAEAATKVSAFHLPRHPHAAQAEGCVLQRRG